MTICYLTSFLGDLATIATAIIAGCGLRFAKKEYTLHKQRAESETLAKFNERFTHDENINKTIEELIEFDKNKLKIDKEGEKDKKKLRHHEMFLHFFEELQIALENKALDEEHVCHMFAYYAIQYERDFYHIYIKDDVNTWKRYHQFVQTMKRVAKENEYFPELMQKVGSKE